MEQTKEGKEHHEHKTESHEGGHGKKELSKSFYNRLYFVLVIALVLFGLYNMSQISSFGKVYDQKLAEAKEAARPAEIQLTVITTTCKDCYDINAVVGVIESTGVNVTSKKELEVSSDEAKKLIGKYNIEKIPTVIVTGETDKSKSLVYKLKEISEEKEGAYVFTKLEPPFVDSSNGKVRGKISLIHLKNDECEECFNLSSAIDQLSRSGLVFKNKETVDISSDEGKSLISKYGIKKVPTIIMDKEAEVYTLIAQSWSNLGTIESEGSFVMREISPPYYSIEDKSVKGLISMIVLVESSCSECYDPNLFHKPILQRMGVVFSEEKKISISDKEGKDLVNQYKIEKVPTILLRGDVREYPVLVKAWTDVGTVESDGTYVFREVEVARGKYKDLIANEIVDPAKTQTQ